MPVPMFVLRLFTKLSNRSYPFVTLQMTEETRDAAMSGSIGIIMAIGVSSVLGWFLILGLLFSIQDLDSTLASGTGQPVTQIFLDTVGEKGAIVLMVSRIPVNLFLFFNCRPYHRSSSLARCTSAGTLLHFRRPWTLATYIYLYIALSLLPRTLE